MNTENKNDIIAHAEHRYPEEVCGLLLGHKEGGQYIIDHVKVTENKAVDPHKKFLIDPSDIIRLSKEARDKGLTVIGHFHSHPNNSPYPSTEDLNSISDPHHLWLITSKVGREWVINIFKIKKLRPHDPSSPVQSTQPYEFEKVDLKVV